MDTRTKLRVPMEITSNVQIEIMVYSKTSEQRLPTLKKFSTVAPFSNYILNKIIIIYKIN